MAELDIRDAVLTRELDLRNGGKVDVYVWKPFEEPHDHGSAYKCLYKITGLTKVVARYCYGVDAVQAMMLTLQIIGVYLYTSEEYEAGDLTFAGNRDLCFPTMNGEKPGSDDFEKADVLSAGGDMAIIQLVSERFPLIALPAEGLNTVVDRLIEVVAKAEQGILPGRKLKSAVSWLEDGRKYYEAIMSKTATGLPYFKPQVPDG